MKLVAVLVVLCGMAWGQKIPLSVSHKGSDIVGQQFAFSLREAILQSTTYTVATEGQDAFHVAIVSVGTENTGERDNVLSAISVIAYSTAPCHLGIYQTALALGKSRTKEVASDFLAAFDEARPGITGGGKQC